MKRSFILSTLVVMMMAIMGGCVTDGVDEGGIYSVSVGYDGKGGCDLGQDCWYRFQVTFKDRVGNDSSYYAAALIDPTRDDTIWGPTELKSVGGGIGVLYVYATYFNILPNTNYVVGVFQCGSVAGRKLVCRQPIDGNTDENILYLSQYTFSDYCFGTNCTEIASPNQRYYATAQRGYSDIVEASARIETRYADNLCYCDSMTSHSLAAVSVINDEDDNWMFAETGYIRRRWANDTAYSGWYGAVQDAFVYKEYPDGPPYYIPTEGSTPDYSLELDRSTGIWTFRCGDESMMSWAHGTWINKSGTMARWFGEVRGWETDMPGTAANKCLFENCRFSDGVDWFNAALYDYPPKIEMDDSTHWIIERRDDSSFFLWDAKPMP